MSILTLSQVYMTVKGEPILQDISVTTQTGISAIVGPSGSGKSTLLKAMNGSYRLDESLHLAGEIHITTDGGDKVAALTLPPHELFSLVALIHQEPAIFPMSIRDNMLFALNYYNQLSKADKLDLVEEKLKLVGLWDEVSQRLGETATTLSGGQKQRLAIARSLTTSPAVMLFDEPCAALDVHNTKLIEQLLLTLGKSQPIVIVTHNLAQAKRIADYVIVLEGGKITEQGLAKDVFKSPQSAFLSYDAEYL